MDTHYISVLAGLLSTTLFVSSYIPMLLKAFRTKDLRSYSLANILVANLGNAIHWIYIAGLPWGPIWLLHSFYTLATALMLFWYLRYRRAS